MSKEKKNKDTLHSNNVLMCDQMHFDAKEAYKLLRTNVIYTLPDRRCRKIGITSANIGEGKSTVAVNLAYTLSAMKNKVLLVELDLRLPTISKKLNVEYEYGLTDYLAGRIIDKEAISHTSNPYWDVIFSGPIPPTPTELISSEKLNVFINKLEIYYDYIIFDLPPVNVVSDALVAKELIDGYILVVRENYSDKRSLMDCVRQLDFLNVSILGFVLVESLSREGSYRKKYYSKYGKKHYYGKYGRYYGRYGYGYGYGYAHAYEKKAAEVENKDD